jgi:LPXTG-motif cell wall-anchored protein
MSRQKKGFLQIGLVIAMASLFAGYLLVKNVDFSSILAASKTKNYWAWLADKKSEETGKSAYYFKGIVDKQPDNSHYDVTEGCRAEYRDNSTGAFVGAVMGDCGGKENENEPTPTPIVTPTPTPTPTLTPTPTPPPTPTPTPPHRTHTPRPTPTPTETPTSTPTPNFCNGTCGSNYNCQGGYFCYQGFCRNPACPSDSSCGCGATPTPTAPPVLGATAPPQLPKTGADDLGILAGLLGTMGAGAFIFKKFSLI